MSFSHVKYIQPNSLKNLNPSINSKCTVSSKSEMVRLQVWYIPRQNASVAVKPSKLCAFVIQDQAGSRQTLPLWKIEIRKNNVVMGSMPVQILERQILLTLKAQELSSLTGCSTFWVYWKSSVISRVLGGGPASSDLSDGLVLEVLNGGGLVCWSWGGGPTFRNPGGNSLVTIPHPCFFLHALGLWWE